jgi:hypothetical protein
MGVGKIRFIESGIKIALLMGNVLLIAGDNIGPGRLAAYIVLIL